MIVDLAVHDFGIIMAQGLIGAKLGWFNFFKVDVDSFWLEDVLFRDT